MCRARSSHRGCMVPFLTRRPACAGVLHAPTARRQTCRGGADRDAPDHAHQRARWHGRSVEHRLWRRWTRGRPHQHAHQPAGRHRRHLEYRVRRRPCACRCARRVNDGVCLTRRSSRGRGVPPRACPRRRVRALRPRAKPSQRKARRISRFPAKTQPPPRQYATIPQTGDVGRRAACSFARARLPPRAYGLPYAPRPAQPLTNRGRMSSSANQSHFEIGADDAAPAEAANRRGTAAAAGNRSHFTLSGEPTGTTPVVTARIRRRAVGGWSEQGLTVVAAPCVRRRFGSAGRAVVHAARAGAKRQRFTLEFGRGRIAYAVRARGGGVDAVARRR